MKYKDGKGAEWVVAVVVEEEQEEETVWFEVENSHEVWRLVNGEYGVDSYGTLEASTPQM